MSPRSAAGDELFDVVDGDDRVMMQAPRRDVHAQGLRHRAVHILVYNLAGQFFLQQRSLAKDTFPGCWDSACSGHVDAGETYAQAARRELGEELGWRDEALPLRQVTKLSASPGTGQEFIEIYLLGPIEGPFDLHPEEISAGRWITPQALETELVQAPETFAGVVRLLWTQHRSAILEAAASPRFS